MENELEVVEGMRFDRGYISPYFMTDQKTMKAEMENPMILIVEKKISGLGMPPPGPLLALSLRPSCVCPSLLSLQPSG